MDRRERTRGFASRPGARGTKGGGAGWRVLFLLQRPPESRSGAERQAGLLAEALRRRGHAVEIVAGLGPLGTAGHALRCAWRVLRDRPDVVHAHIISAHALAAAAVARATGRPFVAKLGASRLGDVALSRATLAGRVKLALVLRWADAFVAPNAECVGELRALDVPERRLRRIPNGVDLARFSPAAAARRSPLGVLFAGRLEAQKGLDVLLEAWPRVEGARLVIAGDGSLAAEVARRAAGLAAVEIVGPVDDPLPLYRAASVFVLPSRAEGISNALLEAMACGCAPVATRIGGNVDVIEDGVSGVLVPPEDPAALAEGIRAALGRAGEIGAAARRRVEAEFGIDAVAERVEELYREVKASFTT